MSLADAAPPQAIGIYDGNEWRWTGPVTPGATDAADQISIYRVDGGFVVADLGGWIDGIYLTRAAALAAAEK